MGAIVVVDAFWGDSGKGKIAAFLARKHNAAVSVRAGTGTNAGHSVIFAPDRTVKTRQLPLAGVLASGLAAVGSGVAVDPEVLAQEIADYDDEFGVGDRVRIDRRCPVILPEHREREAEDLHLVETVGSTMSGTGVAQAEFCLRRAVQAKSVADLEPYVTDVAGLVNRACAGGETVVVEGSQGTFLSLALSDEYPLCTSGNCTTVALADDVGLNWRHIDEVVLVVKAMPSRVGAGALPFAMSVAEQDYQGVAEHGVVTGRRRGKASRISWDHLRQAVELNGPTQIALTFCDHYDSAVSSAQGLTRRVEELIARVEDVCGVPVTMVEVGKFFEDVIDREGYSPESRPPST
jgi:adenylosuccinate synthase